MAAVPLQNRVDPFGDLRAVPDRGAWLGNRGILHDDDRQIVRWARGRPWIICRLAFKGRRRSPMTPGTWTELFFLDEATAFAAGHRPCGECRRDDHRRFTRLAAPGRDPLTAGELDRRLDGERRRRSTRVVDYGTAVELPPGSMIDLDGTPHLWWEGALRPWSFAGYGPPVPPPRRRVPVLTPPTTRRVLAAGYAVQVDRSAAGRRSAGP